MLQFSRAADGGAILRRVAERDASVPSSAPVSYAFWNPFTLQFATRSVETRYTNETQSTILEHDLLTHFIGCFPGPFFVYNLRAVLPVWFSILWLFLSLVYAPMNIYIRCYHKEFYMRHRLLSVVFVRFIIPFCFMGFGIYDTPPAAKLSAIVMTICTKSPVSNMSFSSMNLRVMFCQHIILHTVALAIAFLWIPGFCHTCSKASQLTDKFNEFGYGIDWLFSYGLLNKLPDPKAYPCWMIAALIICVFGYIIPTFIVFVAEVTSRSVYLQSRISEDYQESLSKFTRDAIRVGSVACVTCIIATWFLVSLLRDAVTDVAHTVA